MQDFSLGCTNNTIANSLPQPNLNWTIYMELMDYGSPTLSNFLCYPTRMTQELGNDRTDFAIYEIYVVI